MTETRPWILDEQGRINVFIKAVPFDGPVYLDEKDLQGHRFTPDTDLGPLKEAVSYLDHNKLVLRYPELKNFEGIDDRLGTAVKELSTEEGVIYRIIVDERYKYKNLIKALAEQRMLDGSTTPYQRGVRFNKSDESIIDRWEVAEVTATWIPANPDATQQEIMLMKSVILEDLKMGEVTDTVNPENAETKVEGQSDTPLTDLMDNLLTETQEEKSVPTLLAELASAISAMNTRMETFENNVTAQLGTQEKSINDIKTAFPKFGELAARAFSVQLKKDGEKSGAEKEAEKHIVVKTPENPTRRADAPGRQNKASFAAKEQ